MQISVIGGRVQLIFANNNDRYFGEDLRETDILRSLWTELHRVGFSCVYFLSQCSSGFCISDYGDREAKHFVKSGIPFAPVKTASEGETKIIDSPSAKDMRNVILPEWDKHKSAIISGLADFYNTVKAGDWRDSFSDFVHERTGNAKLFLIVTPETENMLKKDAILSLLDDSYMKNLIEQFDGHNEKSIRDSLFHHNCRGCSFTDDFDKSQIRNILFNLMIKDSRKFNFIGELDSMTEYLRTVLDREVPADNELGLKNIVRTNNELYNFFMAPDKWKQLVTMGRRFDSMRSILTSSGSQSEQEFLSYRLSTGETVERLMQVLEERLNAPMTEATMDYRITYCMFELSQLLLRQAGSDYETRGQIMAVLLVFLKFSEIDSIPQDSIKELMDCWEDYRKLIQLSRQVYLNSRNADSIETRGALTGKLDDRLRDGILLNREKIKKVRDILDSKMKALFKRSVSVETGFDEFLREAEPETIVRSVSDLDYDEDDDDIDINSIDDIFIPGKYD